MLYPSDNLKLERRGHQLCSSGWNYLGAYLQSPSSRDGDGRRTLYNESVKSGREKCKWRIGKRMCVEIQSIEMNVARTREDARGNIPRLTMISYRLTRIAVILVLILAPTITCISSSRKPHFNVAGRSSKVCWRTVRPYTDHVMQHHFIAICRSRMLSQVLCLYRDLKDIGALDLAVRKKLSGAIRDACINVGFLYSACEAEVPDLQLSSASLVE